MLEHLENLCKLNGTSGNEETVREYICRHLKGKTAYSIDNLGNIITFKPGRKTPDKKIMFAAHMDEVGMIITAIKEDGTLVINSVGGIDPSVIIGRQVTVGAKGINGVIGSKAVHNLSAEEKDSPVKINSLYVDIGAEDRADAEKYVSTGDFVYFPDTYETFGAGNIVGKALDDRIGCAIMLDMVESEIEYDTYFVFTTQEEIGTRGAKVAGFHVQPDFAVVLETTTACDIPESSGERRVCELGKGAVVSYMDRATIYDRELYRMAFEVAEEKGIPCQTKTMVAGGNDSGAIHTSAYGVRTMAISAPCRYLHSPVCVLKYSDVEACERLAFEMLVRIGQL